MKSISGKFAIKSTPMESDPVSSSLGIMKMKFEKKFEGLLSGEGLVFMIGLLNKELGSGAYSAIEKFEGSVDGKKGIFYMQHSSKMNKGVPLQSISVIPDSATGELIGLAGEMEIEIKEAQHYYKFKYEIQPMK